MTPEDFKASALDHLERLDEADQVAFASQQPTADLFADLFTRWLHARQAFPGMSWEEFGELDAKRNRKGSRHRPPRSLDQRADEPLWRAARDADRIKGLWLARYPGKPRPRPPMHPHQIAAERHGVSRQNLDEQMRRSSARRLDRKAAQN